MQTVRTVFIIGPDKKIKLMLSLSDEHGPQFRRSVCGSWIPCSSLRKHRVATPVNWKPGDDVIIVPAVSDEEAKKIYPGGWKTVRPYLRIVPQPQK